MNVQIGDKVRFLDDVGEGIITRIVNKSIANVLTGDGFEIPSHIDQLVVIEKASDLKKEIAPEPISPINNSSNYVEYNNSEQYYEDELVEIEGNDKPNVFFAFVTDKPDDLLSASIDTFLVNDCNYFVMYNIAIVSEDSYIYLNNGTLHPNTKYQINSFKFEQLKNIEQFSFNLIFFKKGQYQPVAPIQNILKLNYVKFHKSGCFENNDFFEEKALIYCITNSIEENIKNLTENDLMQITKDKQASEELQKSLAEKFKARPEPVIIEVDLHINQLLIDCRGLSNQEILDFQMKHFHSKMNECITSNVSRLVFIHGIGNGTLKNEVRKSLTNEYPKYKFQDASFKEYGFGATMVILK